VKFLEIPLGKALISEIMGPDKDCFDCFFAGSGFCSKVTGKGQERVNKNEVIYKLIESACF
jgi:hypothetical protein